MCDNAARNAFLDELNVKWRIRGAEKQMFQYMGLNLCANCIAACIGCCPETVDRARRKRERGQKVERKVGSGRRPAVKSNVFVLSRSPLELQLMGRIWKMALEEGNIMPNSDKVKLPYPNKKPRIKRSGFTSHQVKSRLLAGRNDEPELEISPSYARRVWAKDCSRVRCSRYSSFGFYQLQSLIFLGKCDTCTKLEEEANDLDRSIEARQKSRVGVVSFLIP